MRCLLLPIGLLLLISNVHPALAFQGDYGPVFQEVGFHERGNYFHAGFEAVVNKYGGNLTVTSTDVSIPSTGGFGLFFSRTHNSNYAYDADLENPIPNHDSPLGIGWVSHLGIFYPDVQTGGRHVWIDSSGARELFYTHNHLHSQIPISGSGNLAWISSSLKILTPEANNTYKLRLPNGLVYTLSADNGSRFYKPTKVEDIHGNDWTITYHSASDTEYTFPTGNGVINHPMVQSIRDDWGRRLDFTYQTTNGKKRLTRITLGSQVLARYSYQTIGGNSYLRTHKTGENRTTTFTTDNSGVGEGTIQRIQADTGGTMTFTYAQRTFYYRSGLEPKKVYAVTSHSHAGGTWTYQYPNNNANNGIFSVTISGPEGFQGTYNYSSYDSDFSQTDLHLVGTMISSTETRSGTSVTKEHTYGSFKISDDLIVDQVHAEKVLIPRMTQSRTRVDNTWLTTDYSYDSSDFTFPTKVDGPSVLTEHDYVHRTSNSAYMLGLPSSQVQKFNNTTIAKTTWLYQAPAVNPYQVRQFTNKTVNEKINLKYHTTGSGYKGMVREKDRSGLAKETYTYQNGVLKGINYLGDFPDVSRTINANGTIQQETSNGITKRYSWDDDFRLTQIQHPDDNIGISYTSNTVTVTQGPTWLKETYDAWGRFSESETRIDGSAVTGTHSVAYDQLGQMENETLPSGATYSYTYDVQGRLRSKNAGGINDDFTFSYVTENNGNRKTSTRKNGAIDSVVTVDALGRVLKGSLEGKVVNSSYHINNQTISITGHSNRTIDYDFLGRKLSENHPETDLIQYRYNDAGWMTRELKRVADFHYSHDDIGRIKQVKRGGTVIIDYEFEGTYGKLSQLTHGNVILDFSQFDGMGRAQRMTLTVPETLSGPAIAWPSGDQPLSAINNDPQFRWQTITGASNYQFELKDQGATKRQQGSSTQINFGSLTFSPIADESYEWRARGLKSNGEIGPWSPWVPLNVKGEPTISVDTGSISARVPVGSNPTDQVVEVWNGGTGTLQFNLNESPAWLAANPTSGTSQGSADTVPVTLSFATSTLAEGTYAGIIDLTGQAGVPNQTLTVDLEVYGEPSIVTSTAAISVSAPINGTSQVENLTISNGGTGTLNASISVDQPWLQVTPTTGSSTGSGDPIALTVILDPTGLEEQIHQATITVSGGPGVSSKSIAVSFTVFGEPQIGFSPSNLTLTAPINSDPQPLTLDVWNAGTGTLDFSASDNRSWIALNPENGSSSGVANPTQVTVTLDPGTLGEATHSGVITLSAHGLATQTVPVTLTLVTEPTISTSRGDISLSIPSDAGQQTETFDVWNGGTGLLNYSVSADQSWVLVTPISGTSNGSSDRDRLTVTLNPNGLPPNQAHTGTITIQGQSGVTPRTIPVSLTLNENPLITVAPTPINLSYFIGDAQQQETFTITNAGQGTLNYSLAETATWLTLNRNSGSLGSGGQDQVIMTINVNALQEGDQITTIAITGQTGVAPVSLPINVTLVGEPIISTTPTQFNISSFINQGPVSQNLSISNTGTGTLQYQLDSDVNWIAFSQTHGSVGTTSSATAVSFLTQNLPEGSHHASITVSGQDGVTPHTIPVTVTITTQPAIALDTTQFIKLAGLNTGPLQDSFKVWNGGTGILQYTVNTNTSWLEVLPANGNSSDDQDRDTITTTFRTQNLSEGRHTGTITVSSLQSGVASVTIPITVDIVSEPLISVSPSTISQNATLGSGAMSVPLSITNSGTGTLDYSLSSDQPWLSFSSPSGQSSGETDAINVLIDTPALELGTNTASITISGQVGVTAQTMVVTINVSADGLTSVGHYWHEPDFCVSGSSERTRIGHLVRFQNNHNACQ